MKLNNNSNRFKFVKDQREYKKAIIHCCRVLPNSIIIKIYDLAFPKWSLCDCKKQNTCYLCEHACCENAVAVFCVCLLCTKCSKHGTRCHGNHG